MICGHCKTQGVTVDHVRHCNGATVQVDTPPQVVTDGKPKTQSFRLKAALDASPLGDSIRKAADQDDIFDGVEEPQLDPPVSVVPSREKRKTADIPEEDRVYMAVPYEDRIEAKKLGARWDPERKQWFWDRDEVRNWDLLRDWWPKEEVVLEDGIYRGPDKDPNSLNVSVHYYYWMVYHTVHGAGQQVAKKLIITEEQQALADENKRRAEMNEAPLEGTVGEWAYIGKSPLKNLTPEMKLSDVDASVFGQVYGWCNKCGRPLTNEESKKRGYGPDCWAKMGF